ncbi:MAG: hypothetical protein ACTSQU_17295 [Promethearchaeota archaeon]
MSYTIAEKVLKEHSNLKEISPGQFVDCDIDMIMVHEQLGVEFIWNMINLE